MTSCDLTLNWTRTSPHARHSTFKAILWPTTSLPTAGAQLMLMVGTTMAFDAGKRLAVPRWPGRRGAASVAHCDFKLSTLFSQAV
jgi:hypothetical protein